MKCPRCGYNSPSKWGMKCLECNYQFTLSPGVDGIADLRMVNSIKKASGNGQYYFTKNQLYGAYTTARKKPMKRILLAIMILACIISIVIQQALTPVSMLMIIATGVYIGYLVNQKEFKSLTPLDRDAFLAIFDKWMEYNEEDKYLEKLSLHNPPEASNNTDQFDYGVEGILIVDQNRYVDMLVRNGLHQEFNLLVIAHNGYPTYLKDHAIRLLEAQPELPVYWLHDAAKPHDTTQEIGPAGPLASHWWRTETPNIYDLGIYPSTVRTSKAMRSYRQKLETSTIPLDMIHYSKMRKGLSRALNQKISLTSALVLTTGGGFAGFRGGGSGSDFDGGDFG